MGKKTRIHPVSLHVIRGAAEYCGFRFGKIKQTSNDNDLFRAIYDAEIVEMPRDLATKGTLLQIHHDLQECFVDDIRIEWVHMTKSGKWSCQIFTYAKPPNLKDHQLLPNPEPSLIPIGGGGGGGGGAVCERCKQKPVKAAGDWCHACNYQARVEFEMKLDPDDQDWEFAHCEECGSSLWNDGLCHNTRCGASPFVGEDWV